MATPKNNKGKLDITTEFVTLTREVAWLWLDTTDVSNRGVQQQRVHKYARRMMTDKWSTTGETIKFDPDGNLLDGQHRIWAFLETQFEEMEFLVMRGVPRESQVHMDTGSSRTTADTLSMRGIPDGRLLSAAIKLVTQYEAGVTPGGGGWRFQPDNEDVLDAVALRPNLRVSADYIATEPGFKAFGKPSAMVFAHFITTSQNPAMAQSFWKRLLEADYRGQGDPIMRLRERLLIAKATRQGAPNTSAICAMTIKAWNAFVRNRPIGPLHWSQNGERPEKFPKAIARSRNTNKGAPLKEVI
jgi:putative intracellular protease/amidase